MLKVFFVLFICNLLGHMFYGLNGRKSEWNGKRKGHIYIRGADSFLRCCKFSLSSRWPSCCTNLRLSQLYCPRLKYPVCSWNKDKFLCLSCNRQRNHSRSTKGQEKGLGTGMGVVKRVGSFKLCHFFVF